MGSEVWLIMADSIKSSVAFYWHWLNSQTNWLDIAWTVIERLSVLVLIFAFWILISYIISITHSLPLCPWHQTNSGHGPLNPAAFQRYIFELSVWNICQENIKLLSRLLPAWLKQTHTLEVGGGLLYGEYCILALCKNCDETEYVLYVSAVFPGGKVGSWVCLNGSILSPIKN